MSVCMCVCVLRITQELFIRSTSHWVGVSLRTQGRAERPPVPNRHCTSVFLFAETSSTELLCVFHNFSVSHLAENVKLMYS